MAFTCCLLASILSQYHSCFWQLSACILLRCEIVTQTYDRNVSEEGGLEVLHLFLSDVALHGILLVSRDENIQIQPRVDCPTYAWKKS